MNHTRLLVALVVLVPFLTSPLAAAEADGFLHPPGALWGMLGGTNFGVRGLALTPEGAVVVGQQHTVFDDTNALSAPAIARIAGEPGVVVLSTNYPDSGPFSYMRDVVPVLTSGNVLQGFVFAGFRNYDEGAYGGPWAWVVKTDPDLVWQWEAHIGTVAHVGGASTVARRGSGFLVGGWDAYSTGEGEFGWLGQFDAEGNLLGDHLDGVGGQAVNGITSTADGGYLLAKDHAVTKVDSALTFQWSAGDAALGEGWNSYQTAKAAPAGDVFGLAHRMHSTPGVPLNVGSVVTRFASNGDIAWSQFHPDAHMRDLVPTADGGVLVVGVKDDGLNGGSDLWLIKIEPDASPGWEMSIGGNGDDSGRAIEVSPDGNYLLAGSAWVDDAHRLWVLKVSTNLQPATPMFTMSPASPVFRDQAVTFDATGSTPPPGDAIGSCLWDFGDGTTATGSVVTHRYHTGGTNTITLTVVTTNGVFKSVQHDATVIGLAIQWERLFGSNWQDMGNSFVEAVDGGFIIAGATSTSYVDQNHLWLWKTDRRGHTVWEKFFDGPSPGSEVARCIIPAHDTGYMVAGDSYRYPAQDGMLLKVDENGELIWPVKYLGTSDLLEQANCIAATGDGGYVLLGTQTTNGVPAPWLMKTDADGNPTWDRRYPDTYGREGVWVAPASDGGHVLIGEASSVTGWLLKVDASGGPVWTNQLSQYSTYRWVGPPEAMPEGHVLVGTDNYNIMMKFLDPLGEELKAVEWNGTTTARRTDNGNYATRTPDGGLLVVGKIWPEGASTYAPYEAALIKTDAEGNEHWIQTQSSTTNVSEEALAAVALTNGSYVVLGRRETGDSRIWLFKVAPNHPPVADLQVSTIFAFAGAPLTFDASRSTDRDGTVAVCEWDFGDGFTTNGVTAQHGYATAGRYVVRLTAVDDQDAEHTVSRSVFVIGVAAGDTHFTLGGFSVTNAPGDDPPLYPKPGAPPLLDWENALGFHLEGAATSSTARTIRATFEETLPTNGFKLYQLPDWTPVSYSLVDEHTVQVQLWVPSGAVNLSFVFAGLHSAPVISATAVALVARFSLTFDTLPGFQYRIQRSLQLVPDAWTNAPHARAPGDPISLDTLEGTGSPETVFVELPVNDSAFFRVNMATEGL